MYTLPHHFSESVYTLSYKCLCIYIIVQVYVQEYTSTHWLFLEIQVSLLLHHKSHYTCIQITHLEELVPNSYIPLTFYVLKNKKTKQVK